MDIEGIYRKNGNKAKIKYLKRLFDQGEVLNIFSMLWRFSYVELKTETTL